MNPAGRLLGVDPGRVRLGLAVSDPERRIASPLETYTRRSLDLDARFFREIVRSEDIIGLVVGLPIHNDGREGEQAGKARALGQWLAQTTSLGLAFWDERFSTQEAEGLLLSAGLSNKKRQARRDRVAAQIMLQAYLDAGCPVANVSGSEIPPPAPEA